MENRARVWISILCSFAAVFAALAVYGGVTKNEPLLAGGVSVGVMSLLLLPAFFHRSAALQKLCDQQNPLARWEYSHDEAQSIAQEQKRLATKRSLRLACLFAVCFVIILFPFFLILLQSGDPPAPIVFLSLALVPFMPFVTALVWASAVAKRVVQHPSVTLIGRDYLLLANLYHPLNERVNLCARSASVHKERDGSLRVHVLYANNIRTKTGLYKCKDVAIIPVPAGQESSAKEVAAQLLKQ